MSTDASYEGRRAQAPKTTSTHRHGPVIHSVHLSTPLRHHDAHHLLEPHVAWNNNHSPGADQPAFPTSKGRSGWGWVHGAWTGGGVGWEGGCRECAAGVQVCCVRAPRTSHATHDQHLVAAHVCHCPLRDLNLGMSKRHVTPRANAWGEPSTLGMTGGQGKAHEACGVCVKGTGVGHPTHTY